MAVTRHAASQVAPSPSGGTYTIPIPSGSLVDDIAVIILPVNMTPSGISATAGWTKISPPGTFRFWTLVAFWKKLVSADLSTNVVISGVGTASIYASVEVWGGALAPTSVFNATTANQYTLPSATAPVGSVPLYIWWGYDTNTTQPVPTAMSAPAGWVAASYRSVNSFGLGTWFTNPLTTANAPGGTLTPTGGTTGAYAFTATIILPPAVTNNAYIAGSTSAGDVLCSVILAGSTAAADTTLLWTP